MALDGDPHVKIGGDGESTNNWLVHDNNCVGCVANGSGGGSGGGIVA